MYFKKMKDFVNSLTSKNWFFIEFSVLGFIGKPQSIMEITLTQALLSPFIIYLCIYVFIYFLTKTGSFYVAQVGHKLLSRLDLKTLILLPHSQTLGL